MRPKAAFLLGMSFFIPQTVLALEGFLLVFLGNWFWIPLLLGVTGSLG